MWLVGSSRISRSARSISARASATRLRCPPLSVADRRVEIGDPQPGQDRLGVGLGCPAVGAVQFGAEPGDLSLQRGVERDPGVPGCGWPLRSCAADASGANRCGRWSPTRSGGRPVVGSCARYSTRTPPQTVTEPLSGASRPAMMRSSVVLPLPLTPISPMRSPALMSRLASSKSSRSPNCLVRLSMVRRFIVDDASWGVGCACDRSCQRAPRIASTVAGSSRLLRSPSGSSR